MKTIRELLQKIGENLHTIRNARKETLQSVAKSIGITHPVLSKIENGRSDNLSLALLLKICNYYKISMQQVMAIESATIFQLTQHNQDGSQKLIGQEIGNGFELCIKQYQEEISFLKQQNLKFLEVISKQSLNVLP